MDRANYLSSRARDEEALALLMPFTRDIAATVARDPSRREVVQDAGYALLALGRDQEAIAVMRALAALPIAGNASLINSKIDYLQILVESGRYREALDQARALEANEARYANDYGKAWIASETVCALAGLDRTAQARPHLARLHALARANPVALTEAYLCAGDSDGAAAILIRRLDGDEPASAILALQDFEAGGGRPDPLYARLRALRDRPDVRAALARVGRLLNIPLPRSYWGFH
jgi:tetratricopeptide (TPR) repeat protein